MRKNDTLNKIASWHIHQFITDSKMLSFIFEFVQMYKEVKIMKSHFVLHDIQPMICPSITRYNAI